VSRETDERRLIRNVGVTCPFTGLCHGFEELCARRENLELKDRIAGSASRRPLADCVVDCRASNLTGRRWGNLAPFCCVDAARHVMDARDAADINAIGIIPDAMNISLGSKPTMQDESWREPALRDCARPIVTTCEIGPARR
jgi:hypothetical protein